MQISIAEAVAEPHAPAPRAARHRIDSVDLLRGAVMILMALDHTRDFFTDAFVPPLSPSQSDPALYGTRWITHLCAPNFMFLAGLGAALSLSRGKSLRELSRFLVTRGLFLIAADQVVMPFLWELASRYSPSS